MPHSILFSIRAVCIGALLAVVLGLTGRTTVAQVDLSLHTAEQEVEVPNGSAVPVPLTLENRSRSRTATDVTIEVRVPAGVAVVTDSASRGWYNGGTWTVETLAAGDREMLHLRLGLHASTPRVLMVQLDSVAPDDPTGAALRVRVVPGAAPEKPSVAKTPPGE